MSDTSPQPANSGISRVLTATRELSQAMAQASSGLYQESGVTAAMRSVMGSLFPDTALTVPDIARNRQVTRQHIQTLVNDLLRRDLVQAETNPAHKRSPLIRLTPLGRLSCKVILSREQKLLQTIAGGFDETRLSQTADALDELVALFNAGAAQDLKTP